MVATGLVVAAIFVCGIILGGIGEAAGNRLAHRDGVIGFQHDQQYRDEPDGPAKGPIQPFVVLHGDSTWTDALASVIDDQAQAWRDLWLYGELPRWIPHYAERLWRFECGRTKGRWPACEETTTKASPGSVGFAMDVNLIMTAAGEDGALVGDVVASLKDHKVKAVVLRPSNVVRAALCDLAHGHHTPLTRDVPGRVANVARSQYAPDAGDSAYMDLAFRGRDRHLRVCVPEGHRVDDAGADAMIAVLRRHKSERDRLDHVAAALSAAGVPVHVIGIHEIINVPKQVFMDLRAFLVPKTSRPVSIVSPSLTRVFQSLDMGAHLLEDCVGTLERARIRLAVDDAHADSKDLIADLDVVLGKHKQDQQYVREQVHEKEQEQEQEQDNEQEQEQELEPAVKSVSGKTVAAPTRRNHREELLLRARRRQ